MTSLNSAAVSPGRLPGDDGVADAFDSQVLGRVRGAEHEVLDAIDGRIGVDVRHVDEVAGGPPAPSKVMAPLPARIVSGAEAESR